MKRKLWPQTMSKTDCPAWPCPRCKKGTPSLDVRALEVHETASSKSFRDHEAWEPDWIEYRFNAWAACGHAACKERVALAGIGGVISLERPAICTTKNYVVETANSPRGPQSFDGTSRTIDLVEGGQRSWCQPIVTDNTLNLGRYRVNLREIQNRSAKGFIEKWDLSAIDLIVRHQSYISIRARLRIEWIPMKRLHRRISILSRIHFHRVQLIL
jgi:hypothetical protein